MAHLGEIASARGPLALVEIPFVASQRNRPAALFLESLAQADENGVFRLSAEAAARVRYRVGQAVPPAHTSRDRDNDRKARPQAGEAGGTACPTQRIDYLRIATELRHPCDPRPHPRHVQVRRRARPDPTPRALPWSVSFPKSGPAC